MREVWALMGVIGKVQGLPRGKELYLAPLDGRYGLESLLGGRELFEGRGA